MSLEAKVMELGRLVLGPDVVLSLDPEHVIDRAMDKLRGGDLPPDVAPDIVEEIRQALGQIDDLDGDVSFVRMKLEGIERKLSAK